MKGSQLDELHSLWLCYEVTSKYNQIGHNGATQVSFPHLVHIHPFEGGLQQLEVVNVLMLQFSLELNLLKTDAAWEEQIHELAVGRS